MAHRRIPTHDALRLALLFARLETANLERAVAERKQAELAQAIAQMRRRLAIGDGVEIVIEEGQAVPVGTLLDAQTRQPLEDDAAAAG